MWTYQKVNCFLYCITFVALLGIASCNRKFNKGIEEQNNCSYQYDSLLKTNVFLYVSKRPEYPGGNAEFLKFFAKNFKHPSEEIFQEKIVLSFIVDVDGEVVDQGIYNKQTKDYTAVDMEALRILKMAHLWEPGKCEGKIVPVRIYFPINF